MGEGLLVMHCNNNNNISNNAQPLFWSRMERNKANNKMEVNVSAFSQNKAYIVIEYKTES